MDYCTNYLRSVKVSLLLINLLFLTPLTHGQQTFNFAVDTVNSEESGFVSIPEIDYEIEKITNYLDRTSKKIKKLNAAMDADSTYSIYYARIEKEAHDFDSYDPEDLSKFFLENSHRIWSAYKKRLSTLQSRSFDMLTSAEERNNNLEKKEKTWKKTYENTKSNQIPDLHVKKIRSIQKRINKQHNENYKISLRIITYESLITNRLSFVESKLRQIESLQQIYADNLYKRTASPIWSITLNDSEKGHLKMKISQAWHDNTKYLVVNYQIYFDALKSFIFISLLLLAFYFFLRKHYSLRFGHQFKSKVDEIKYVIFNHSYAALLSTVLFVFFIVFENLPLALSKLISLVLLLSIYFTMKGYFTKDGELIVKKFILLMILNTFEILIWYLGDYSRLYLLFETGVSVWFVYQYITLDFSRNILPHMRYKNVLRVLRIPMFLIFLISFIANILGYINLTIFLQKMAIQSIVLIILIIGMWHIISSFINLNTDLISRNPKLKLNSYMPLFKKRIMQFFRLYFAYILFISFLNLFELKTAFYQGLNDFLFLSRRIGSIEITMGEIFLFVGILLFSWGLNVVIKIIFDEEHYQKYASLRGIPSAISMTLRILFTSIAIFFAFSAAGFDMKNFSIIIGALGVGIGFGLQNIVNDYISGLILIYERPVQKGDTVEVNNLLGEVLEIGIRRSNVRTFDGAEVIIPNASLTSNQLTNWTLSDKQKRLDIRIGVAYGSDPAVVIELITKAAAENSFVLNMPPPRVLFNDFGDSSLNFRLLCWVLLENGIQAKSDISVSIYREFSKNDINIPFPQMDLHIKGISEEKETNINVDSKQKVQAQKEVLGSDSSSMDEPE